MVLYYPRASLGKRFIAITIDTLISALSSVVVLALILSPLVVLFTQQDTAWADRFNADIIIALYVALPLSFFWFCFYSLLRDSFGKGQSWGEKLCGLMVIDLTSKLPCNKKKAFARNYLAFSLSFFMMVLPVIALSLPLIEPLYIIFSEQGLRIGDHWSQTQVIEYKNRFYYLR